MTASYQLGLLVRPRSEERFPYPDPFTPSELLIIEEALAEAWRRVVRVGISDEYDEIHLTTRLIDELDQLMNTEPHTIEGFDAGTDTRYPSIWNATFAAKTSLNIATADTATHFHAALPVLVRGCPDTIASGVMSSPQARAPVC